MRPGCVIHFPHCPGPWHGAPPPSLPSPRSQATASLRRWVRMGSGVYLTEGSPIPTRCHRSECIHFHGNGLPIHLAKGATEPSLNPLQYFKGDLPSCACDQGGSGSSLYIRTKHSQTQSKSQFWRLHSESESLTLGPTTGDREGEGRALSR